MREIVKTIQLKKGWNIEQVAKSVGYSRVYLSRLVNQAKKNDSEDEMIKKLTPILQNVNSGGSESIMIYSEGQTDKDYLMDKATLKAVFHQVAKLSAKVFDRKFEDCLAELEQNTILILKDLQESK